MVTLLLFTVLAAYVLMPFADCQPYELTSNNVSGSLFCPGKAEFYCTGVNVINTFEWYINDIRVGEYTFRTTDNVTFPIPFPNLRANAASYINVTGFSAASNINITSSLTANVSDLLGNSIKCGFDATRSSCIEISSQVYVPSDFSSIDVQPTYNHDLELDELKVVWNISDTECTGIEFRYNFMLVNGSGDAVKTVEKMCTSNISCSIIFTIPSSNTSYRVVIASVDNGLSILYMSSNFSGVSNITSIPSLDITSSGCLTTIECISSLDGNCKIFVSQDRSNSKFQNPVEIQINSSTILSDLAENTLYYFIALFNIGDRIEIEVNHTTGQRDAKLTTENIALIALGVIFFVVSFCIFVVPLIQMIKWKKNNSERVWANLFLVLLILSGIVVIIDFILWIVLAIVLSEDNTCDSTWQFHRNNLIIAVFVFALVSLLLLIPLVCFVLCFRMKSEKRSHSIHVKEEHEILKENPQKAKKKVNQQGMIPEVEAYLSTSAHRKLGESSEDARLRIPEERTAEIKKAINKLELEQGEKSDHRQVNVNTDGNEYHTTRFQTDGNQASGNTAGPTEGYASLDRPGKKASNSSHYHHLHDNHKQKSGGSAPSFRGDNSTYSELGAQSSGNGGQHDRSTKGADGRDPKSQDK